MNRPLCIAAWVLLCAVGCASPAETDVPLDFTQPDPTANTPVARSPAVEPKPGGDGSEPRADEPKPGGPEPEPGGVEPEPGGVEPESGDEVAAEAETTNGAGWGLFGDPFAPQELPASGLTNVGESLNDVLENGALEGACDRYADDPTNELKRLLCGKWMFFYQGFGTRGVPQPLVDFLLENFEEELGQGFSKLGLIADPSSESGYPLGMALNQEGTELSFTCASCHFSALPDGRFAIGAPNLDYEYGLHTLSFSVFPAAVMNSMGGLGMGQPVHPDALAKVQPLVDKMDADWTLKGKFMLSLSSLLGMELPEFPEEQQAQYARWLPGTMDFVAAPLPVDDGVEVISKISAIYAIPSVEEEQQAEMVHSMLGWTGNTRTVAGFIELFVDFGGGEPSAWNEEDFAPLLEFVTSLRPPEPPPQEEALVEAGETVFLEAGCVDCHQGPRGSGTRLFSFEEIGTDEALKQWMDPGATGEPCCDKDLGQHELTYAVKSPRLVGLWAMERFLHNGSVGSLDELLCLGAEVPPIEAFAYANSGHEFGCELSVDEKVALIAYLESH